MNKIGILYFCVGRYRAFWKAFYESCESKFIPNIEKHYFVFTDAEKIIGEENNTRIHRIYQESLGWPLMSLMRFDIFLKIKSELEKYDYLVFFNANIIFTQTIFFEDFFPVGEQNLLACQHPYYFDKNIQQFPYCRDEKSTAYIPFTEGKYYVQGALQGGKSQQFIEAIETLRNQVQLDLENNVFAIWYDESHWNKYVLGRGDVKILTPSYLYPEDGSLPFKKKIEIVSKGRHFGFDYLRGKRDTPESNFKLFFKDRYRLIMAKLFKRDYYK